MRRSFLPGCLLVRPAIRRLTVSNGADRRHFPVDFAAAITTGGFGEAALGTPPETSDRRVPELLDQIPEGNKIGIVTVDGAYDTHRCHTAIIERQATAIIPIRKNGRPWKEDCPAAEA